jgi:hypothetical protein
MNTNNNDEDVQPMLDTEIQSEEEVAVTTLGSEEPSQDLSAMNVDGSISTSTYPIESVEGVSVAVNPSDVTIEDTGEEVSETTEEVTEETVPEINNRSVRFSGASWYKPGIKLIVGGVGGIGSWLSLALARQEAILYLFDMDEVDETNMGGQHYRTSDIARNKAEVMREQILEYCGNVDVTALGEYTEESFTGPIVFSAFDSMEARKIMFERWVEYINSEEGKDKPALFIDGRLLAEEMKVFAVTRADIEKYRTYLWDDSEIEELECSYKATTHCSMSIASIMVSVYNNYIANVNENAMIREVPFLTEFTLPLMRFKMSNDEFSE